MSAELANQWAEQFGLAPAPLFEAENRGDRDTHSVLLDGGFGSFAMSVADDPLWRNPTTAAWAWSSNLPHHVTVTEKIVAVRRWDRPKAEEFSRASVEIADRVVLRLPHFRQSEIHSTGRGPRSALVSAYAIACCGRAYSRRTQR